MRERVVGSNFSPATHDGPVYPAKLEAIMMEVGGQTSSPPDGYLFPIALNVDRMIKYRWLIKSWKVKWTSHIPLLDIFNPEISHSSELIFTSTAANEKELSDVGPRPFINSSSVGTVITDNGVDPPVTQAYQPTIDRFGVCQLAGFPVPHDEPDLNRYYFNTATRLYQPRIEFEMRHAAGYATNFTQEDDENVNTSIQTFQGTWDGAEINIDITTFNGREIDVFTFVATPAEYWEYRDSNGQNPIWDNTTGIELYDHNTLLN